MLKYLSSIISVILMASLSILVLAAEKPESAKEQVVQILSGVSCQDSQIPDLQSGYQDYPAEHYAIKDVEYLACDRKKIRAYVIKSLVKSHNTSKHPAILYVHWLEPHAKDSNRDEFLQEAKEMAAKGVSSLLVSTFWSIPGGYYFERRWQDDYQNTLNQLRDLQRATVILKAIPNVDANNLHLVGHDYGATFGAMLLGVDDSFSSGVLMAGIADITDWYVYGSGTGIPQGKDLELFKQQFTLVNPYKLIQFSKAQLLFQYAKNDFFISLKQAEALYSQATKIAEVKFYDTDHSLKIQQARNDRMTWLENNVFRK